MDCYDVIIDCNDCRATFASSVFEMFVVASLANEIMKPINGPCHSRCGRRKNHRCSVVHRHLAEVRSEGLKQLTVEILQWGGKKKTLMYKKMFVWKKGLNY